MLEAILDSAGPKEAKAFGRKVQNFDQAEWEQHRFEIVRRGNHAKFDQNDDLKEFLLSTDSAVAVDYGMVAEPKTDYQTRTKDPDSAEPSLSVFGARQSEIDPLEIDSLGDSSMGGSKLEGSNVILVEAAGRDMIWGIGLGQNNPKSRDPLLWRGRNLLGFALTVVREQLRKESM